MHNHIFLNIMSSINKKDGEPVGMTNDSGTSYFGTDILGSVRSVTDKYGAVQSSYDYDAFGSPYLGNLDNGMSFGYTGKAYDAGTGLYDYGFRDYSPNSARFTTVDPIRDGSNWFSYVVNDPVNYVDPLGLKSNKDLKKGAGAHNDLDEYVPTRLEKQMEGVPLYNLDGTPIIDEGTGEQQIIERIDTVVIKPNDFQRGIMDGSRAANGDVWKATGTLETGGVEYRIHAGESDKLDIVSGGFWNAVGDLSKGKNDIKSGYYSADTPQAEFLCNTWDRDFNRDKGKCETWEDYYNSPEQYSVRKCLNEGKQKMYTPQEDKSNSTNISFNFSNGIIGNNITAKNTNNSNIIDNVMDGFKSIIANGIGGLPFPTGCTK